MVRPLIGIEKGKSGLLVYDGRERRVKNLRWLLENRGLVESFVVTPNARGSSFDAVLRANLKGGGYFMIDFASFTVLYDFLTRRTRGWGGLNVIWLDTTYPIGSYAFLIGSGVDQRRGAVPGKGQWHVTER